MAFSLFYAILVPSQNQREAFSTWNAFCCTPAAPLVPSAASTLCGARASSRWCFGTTPTSTPGRSIRPGGTALLAYAPTIGMEVRVQEDYGLKDFVRHVAGDIDHRCAYCYEHRLEGTAKYAAEHGFAAFTSTLLASTYQNHEAIAAAAEMYARQYGVEFLYRDFRSNFRAGNQRARELGFYMQKYCGCVFSEADRYQKQIDRDRAKFDAEEAARQG